MVYWAPDLREKFMLSVFEKLAISHKMALSRRVRDRTFEVITSSDVWTFQGMKRFLSEQCVFNPEGKVSKWALYIAWLQWTQLNGDDKCRKFQYEAFCSAMTETLKCLMPELKSSRMTFIISSRNLNDERQKPMRARGYVGLCLKHEITLIKIYRPDSHAWISIDAALNKNF